MKGGRSWHSEGSYKADHPSAISFLYSVYMYMQKVMLGPSTRIFLAERSEDPNARNINYLGSECPSTRDKKNKHDGGRALLKADNFALLSFSTW